MESINRVQLSAFHRYEAKNGEKLKKKVKIIIKLFRNFTENINLVRVNNFEEDGEFILPNNMESLTVFNKYENLVVTIYEIISVS